MRVLRRETDPVGLQIAPMCDVVFLVLTFFMLTAQLTNRERALPIRLPEEAMAQPDPNARDGRRVVVDLDAAGRLFLGGRPIDPATLRQEFHSRSGALRVYLRADAATPARRIREIVAWSAEAGAVEVILGTAETGSLK